MRYFHAILLFVLLSGCSESTKSLEPGDRVLQFLESPEYEMLSEEDRSVWSQDDWAEHVKSGIIPRPSLSPTNKYFELERHLYSLSTIKIQEDKEEQDGSHSVVVEFRWPSVLGEVYYFNDSLMEFVEEELRNLLSAYESGQITSETLKYSKTIEEFSVLPDGIFINVEKIQRSMEENRKIKTLFADLDYLKDYDLDLDFYSLGSSELIDQVKQLRTIGLDKIRSDIRLLESAIVQAGELKPETSYYSELLTLENLHRARNLLESDSIFRKSLEFINITTAESRGRRGIGLFFDWKISGETLPHEDVNAGFRAKYFDDSNEQIGSETFLISSIVTKNGDRGGSIGRVIDNQGVARRISDVEVEYLVPSRVPRFHCEFDGNINCERR